MRALFHTPWANAEAWLAALRAADPEVEFVRWRPGIDPGAVDAAVVWRPPPELFQGLRHLRCICVLGAGVDDLFAAGMDLPDVPLVRIVDPLMAERMAGWVLTSVLHFQRRFDLYLQQQCERLWRRHAHADTGDVRVGVMGLGAMGRASAELLNRVGFAVAGWSRTPKELAGMRTFAGQGEWAAFLARCDHLACLLPLTDATRGILNARTFAGLPRGAVVVNAGRGGHLVEEDLLAALGFGQLHGAALDVFAEEPLPPEHPFWAHPRILITPHIASVTNIETAAAQVAAALQAVRAGRPPSNLVDRQRGY